MTIAVRPNQAELLRATSKRKVAKHYFVIDLSRPPLNRAERRVREKLAQRQSKGRS